METKNLTKEEMRIKSQTNKMIKLVQKDLKISIFEKIAMWNMVQALVKASKGEPLKEGQIVELQEYLVKCCVATKTSL